MRIQATHVIPRDDINPDTLASYFSAGVGALEDTLEELKVAGDWETIEISVSPETIEAAVLTLRVLTL